jgi:hypothetical protein
MKVVQDAARESLTAARETLDIACENLDAAVRDLPAVNGDNIMASPTLVTLLLRVVNARRHVRFLES